MHVFLLSDRQATADFRQLLSNVICSYLPHTPHTSPSRTVAVPICILIYDRHKLCCVTAGTEHRLFVAANSPVSILQLLCMSPGVNATCTTYLDVFAFADPGIHNILGAWAGERVALSSIDIPILQRFPHLPPRHKPAFRQCSLREGQASCESALPVFEWTSPAAHSAGGMLRDRHGFGQHAAQQSPLCLLLFVEPKYCKRPNRCQRASTAEKCPAVAFSTLGSLPMFVLRQALTAGVLGSPGRLVWPHSRAGSAAFSAISGYSNCPCTECRLSVYCEADAID